MTGNSSNIDPMTSSTSHKQTRIPHVEPLFEDATFVADYSRITKRYAGADYEPILQFTLSALQGVPHPKVLELGPGPGWCAISLAQRCPELEVIGLDLSETYVEIANQNAADEDVEDRVQFQVGNACSLDVFADQSFDAVISNQSFHYWEPANVVLDQIAQVLKPGGSFCIGADRRDLSFFAKIVVWISKWFITADVRNSWMRSFQGSFTAQEAQEMVDQSALRACATTKVFGRMYFIQGQLPK